MQHWLRPCIAEATWSVLSLRRPLLVATLQISPQVTASALPAHKVCNRAFEAGLDTRAKTANIIPILISTVAIAGIVTGCQSCQLN